MKEAKVPRLSGLEPGSRQRGLRSHLGSRKTLTLHFFIRLDRAKGIGSASMWRAGRGKRATQSRCQRLNRGAPLGCAKPTSGAPWRGTSCPRHAQGRSCARDPPQIFPKPLPLCPSGDIHAERRSRRRWEEACAVRVPSAPRAGPGLGLIRPQGQATPPQPLNLLAKLAAPSLPPAAIARGEAVAPAHLLHAGKAARRPLPPPAAPPRTNFAGAAPAQPARGAPAYLHVSLVHSALPLQVPPRPTGCRLRGAARSPPTPRLQPKS